jgi:hypothetical protein
MNGFEDGGLTGPIVPVERIESRSQIYGDGIKVTKQGDFEPFEMHDVRPGLHWRSDFTGASA